jgi:ribosomal protein S18 acetylase RimI-like enzyme
MNIVVRPARPEDVATVAALEQAAFPGDRLSRRSLSTFVGSKSAAFHVAKGWEGYTAGYSIVLFRKSSAIARLYSIAVSPNCRGEGLAKRLIEAAEIAAILRAKSRMRLEVRADNKAAIRLYLELGYKQFGRISGYYDDGADALRFEKTLKHDAVSQRGTA